MKTHSKEHLVDKDVEKVDEFSQDARDFNLFISMAKQTGQEWVEASKAIVDFYNPHGLGGAKYFLFQGIKVCEKGQREAIEKQLEFPMAKKLHGDDEGSENIR